MKKLLALNRSEIAIRILRAANELGLRTVAIYSQEDRLALHRFKADEAYLIGEGKGPVETYLDVDGIVALAREKEIDAIHPGYGFLSDNPALPRASGRKPTSSVRNRSSRQTPLTESACLACCPGLKPDAGRANGLLGNRGSRVRAHHTPNNSESEPKGLEPKSQSRTGGLFFSKHFC
ncbi:hypothetical protein SBA4_560003 [Candidatus Sulfopaludibacter sp. SbA4]|nr:hypothetical protein SBA4_560003 [Candidatus Sulfopaludibacter sp. SbA4]